jgi:hypothetical protein
MAAKTFMNLRPTHEQPPSIPDYVTYDAELHRRLAKRYGAAVAIVYRQICSQAQAAEPCTLDTLLGFSHPDEVALIPKAVKKLRAIKLVHWVDDAREEGGEK